MEAVMDTDGQNLSSTGKYLIPRGLPYVVPNPFKEFKEWHKETEFRVDFIKWYWTQTCWTTCNGGLQRTFDLHGWFYCLKTHTKFKLKRRTKV